MKAKQLLAAIAASVVVTAASAADGLVAIKSPAPVKATADKLEELARQRGLVIFGRIDHAAAASKIGQSLRPTELLIFGSPQAGTPFMACAQTVGIDLPLKALIWEDAAAQVWVGYNDPAYLARRHGADACPAAEGIRRALSALVDAAVAP